MIRRCCLIMLQLALLSAISINYASAAGVSSDYNDICIVDNKDVCKQLFEQWNTTRREYTGRDYCTQQGESMGWVTAKIWLGYIYGYRVSKNRYWLRRFVKEFNGAICREDSYTDNDCSQCLFTNETYDPRYAPEPGWYEVSDWYSIDGKTKFDFIVGEGLILQPLGLFIETVRNDPELEAEFGDDADYYLKLAERYLIPKWDRRDLWIDLDADTGVYLFQNHTGQRRQAMSLPHNQMQEFTQALMTFYRITGNDWYKQRVEKVHNFFISKWFDSSGYVEWHYWDPAGSWDYFGDGSAKHWIDVDQSSGYSAIVTSSVMEGYRNCISFSKEQADDFIRSIKHKADTQSGWYVPVSVAWLDTQARAVVRDSLLADPNGWGARTSDIPEFVYMMENTGHVFYSDACMCSKESILCVDDTPGVSQEYNSIQDAVDDAQPGDTVLIFPGNYAPAGHITIDHSGTEDQPITVSGFGKGTVIDGVHTTERGVFFVDEADYIVIENMEIKNGPSSGIRISWSDHVTARNIVSHDNEKWGIFTSFSNYLLIENNECYNSKEEHGIYVSNSGDYPVVRGNIIHGNNVNGLHMNGDINCQPGDGIISHALVEGNIIYNNGAGGGSAINCDGVTDSVIRNNLVYDQHSSGISLYQIDGGAKSENNEVYHNTIIIADDGRWAVNLKDGSCKNNIYDNILLTEHSWKGSIAADCVDGLDSDYNVFTYNDDAVTPDDDASYMTFSQWQDAGHDVHSVQASISDLFVNYPYDFHLRAGSPAIDAGTYFGVDDDLDGSSRPMDGDDDGDAEPDIGAYEYNGEYIQPESYCGDNTCNNGEDCSSCPDDCGICACTAADTDSSGDISNYEMMKYIKRWILGQASTTSLMDAIVKWKNGC